MPETGNMHQQQLGAAQPDPQLAAMTAKYPQVDWDATVLATGRRGSATSETVAKHVM